MKKKRIEFGIAAVLTMAMTMTSFAAGWQKSDSGWWWQNADGTWPVNAWKWIDGNGDGNAECYYFDSNGYMLAGTTTPDGCEVNADGAWVVNGTVQTQSAQAEPEHTDGLDKMLGTWTLTEVKSGFAESPDNLRSLDGFGKISHWSDRQIAFDAYTTLSILKRENEYYIINNYGFEVLLTKLDEKTFSLGDTYFFLDNEHLVITGGDKFAMVNSGSYSGTYFLGYCTREN